MSFIKNFKLIGDKYLIINLCVCLWAEVAADGGEFLTPFSLCSALGAQTQGYKAAAVVDDHFF